jgi:hypothetical protein
MWFPVPDRPGDLARPEGQLFLVHYDSCGTTSICTQANTAIGEFRRLPASGLLASEVGPQVGPAVRVTR